MSEPTSPIVIISPYTCSSGGGSGRVAEAQLADLKRELREREAASAAAADAFEQERQSLKSLQRAQEDELDILRGKAAQGESMCSVVRTAALSQKSSFRTVSPRAARRLETEAVRLRERVAELTELCEQTRALEASNARYAARLNELEPIAASVSRRAEAEAALRERVSALEGALALRDATLASRETELSRLRAERGAWQQERARLELATKDAEARAEAASQEGASSVAFSMSAPPVTLAEG